MVLSAASRLQSSSGTLGSSAAGVTPFTLSLPAPTAEGSTLLVFLATTMPVPVPAADPPWSLDASHNALLFAYSRSGVPAGETAWAFTPTNVSLASWRVEEWAGIDTVTPLAATATATAAAGAPAVDSGTATTDVGDVAALAAFRASSSSAGTAFPAGHTYSGGFAETCYEPNGGGTATGDLLLATAEAYPGAAGPVSATLSWDTSGGGGYALLAEYGLLVCYRAAGELAQRPGPVMAV